MEWRQHCKSKHHREVCVSVRPRPVDHPCCGSHHLPSQCKYRANYGNLFIGPETVTTKNAYARRQLAKPLDAMEYIESVKDLFEEEEDYVKSIRELFHEEAKPEEEEGAEGEAPIECLHNWREAFNAGPFPKIRSKGMNKKQTKSVLDWIEKPRYGVNR
jgi:hypothetical protein